MNVESAPEVPIKSIENAGIGAWNAFHPKVHPKTLARVLSQVRFGSTINLVGPLLNPTRPTYKVMGVPTLEMIDIAAQTLQALGFKRAFVMHGLEGDDGKGMDEISIIGTTHVAELGEDGSISRYAITPEQFGIARARYEDIASSRDVQRDALARLAVLAGKDRGPKFEVVCLNAAPLLYITGKAATLQAGLDMARDAVLGGKAVAKLRDWVTWQNVRPEDGLGTLEAMLGQI